MLGQNQIELQSFTFSPAGVTSLVYNVFGLPAKRRVKRFVFQLDSVVTAPSGGGATQVQFDANDLVAGLIGFIEHHSGFLNYKGTGNTARQLYHAMHGKAQSDKNFIITTGNAANVRSWMEIPCSDARQLVPYDGAIPTELLNGTTIMIKTSVFTTIGTAPNASPITALMLRLVAELTDADDVYATDPLRTRVDFEDWGGQTVIVKPGLYTHLLGLHADGSLITAGVGGDIERVDFQVNGVPIIDNILSEAVVEYYNNAHVGGGFVDNVREQEDVASFPFHPIFTPDEKYKLTACPYSTTPDSKITFEGTDTSIRVVYRMCEPKGLGLIRQAAKRQGIVGNVSRAVNTASKTALTGTPDQVRYFSRILPGTLK